MIGAVLSMSVMPNNPRPCRQPVKTCSILECVLKVTIEFQWNENCFSGSQVMWTVEKLSSSTNENSVLKLFDQSDARSCVTSDSGWRHDLVSAFYNWYNATCYQSWAVRKILVYWLETAHPEVLLDKIDILMHRASWPCFVVPETKTRDVVEKETWNDWFRF